MNSTRLNPLAEDYLRRLEAAARDLPSQDREDRIMELRGHLEAGLADGASDADVRNLLSDLGSPEEIVAAAALESDVGPPSQRPARAFAQPASPWGAFEVIAVLGLLLGSFIVPIVGPVVGLAFAWASPRWTRKEKTVATVLTLLPLIALVLVGVAIATIAPGAAVSLTQLSQHITGGL